MLDPHTTPLRRLLRAQVNPEYDYVLFTDEDCERFMRELADPDVLRAYEVRAVTCPLSSTQDGDGAAPGSALFASTSAIARASRS